jgi:hypothetical protein
MSLSGGGSEAERCVRCGEKAPQQMRVFARSENPTEILVYKRKTAPFFQKRFPSNLPTTRDATLIAKAFFRSFAWTRRRRRRASEHDRAAGFAGPG